MNFNSEYINDKLASVDPPYQHESTKNLILNLKEILTPDKLNNGVSIDFGDNRSALETVISALEIDKLIDENNGPMHIHNAVVHTPGLTSFIGRSIEQLKILPLIDAVDVLQADRWNLSYEGQSKMYPRIQIRDSVVNSLVLLAHKKEGEDGVMYSDPTLPGIVIGETCRYLPEFGIDDKYDDDFDINYYWKEHIKEERAEEKSVSILAAHVALNGLGLLLPSRSYYFTIGNLFVSGPMQSIASVSAQNNYKLEPGSLCVSELNLVEESEDY